MLLSPSGSDLALRQTIRLAMNEASHVGELRRLAISLAEQNGFGETARGEVAIIATELGTNLLKHAQQGQVLVREICQGAIHGLDFLALDKAPGMSDINLCLRDSYSTSGSAGTGLGAIQRLSDVFEVQSAPNVGTAILARCWAEPRSVVRETPAVVSGAVQVPKTGEDVCGDGWAIDQRDSKAVIVVADGLGHGPQAADASRTALHLFRTRPYSTPEILLGDIHAGLRATRGAAVAVCEIDFQAGKVKFVGLGNIAGTIFAGGVSRSLVSQNGTAGHQAHKIQGFDYEFPRDALLVMHSDGLTTHWRLDLYPGLARRDPQLVAGVLYRDFNRGRDDVTVVAVREAEPPA